MMKPFATFFTATAFAATIAAMAPQALAHDTTSPSHTHHGTMKHADRLDRLKAQLQITQAQEPAWKEFAGSMKQVMTPPAEHAMSHKPGKLQPAPDVLDQHAQRLEDMAQRMKQAAQALRKLYSSLTPKQQAILDTHVADEMHEHRHFAGHHSRSH